MELRRYVAIFRNHALLIIAVVIVALGIGYATTPRTKLYRAEASLYVGPNSISTDTAAATGPLATAQQIIYTYTKMIPSRPIIEAAVQATGGIRPVAVAEAETTAVQVTFTQLVVVQVTDPEPEVAAALANAVVSAFQAKAAGFTGSAAGGVPAFPVYPFENAVVPTVPKSSGLKSRLITSGLFGLVIGAAVSLLVEHLDLTIRGARDAANRLELPVLGAIPVQRQQRA